MIHDVWVESGEVSVQDDGMVNSCPHLDSNSNTFIVIAELEDKIIGTITATVDSKVGLNVDHWFKNDVDKYRILRKHQLGSSWRLATISSFRGQRKLIIDLIAKAFGILIEAGCDICLCALLNKHVKTYQRLIDAEIVLTKNIIFTPQEEQHMETNLVEINLNQGWNKFKRLKAV